MIYALGGQKTDWKQIYIELPESEAVKLFKRIFDRDPHNESCDCCGEDFSVYELEADEVPEVDEETRIIYADEAKSLGSLNDER